MIYVNQSELNTPIYLHCCNFTLNQFTRLHFNHYYLIINYLILNIFCVTLFAKRIFTVSKLGRAYDITLRTERYWDYSSMQKYKYFDTCSCHV